MLRTTSAVTYVGHATVTIEVDGVRLLTDPILRRRASGFLRRHYTLSIPDLRQVDAVLISHLHLDHFDLPSLRMVGRETLLLCPYGTAALLRRHGFIHVRELAVGQETYVKGVAIQATYANHAGRRPPFGPTAHSIGYMIHGSHRIYFAGDTDLFPHMTELSEGLDVALLPVWGWGPTLGAGHMDPQRAAEALALLQPSMAIPIHWGTLHPLGMGWLRPRFLTAPPYLFAHHARQMAPDVHVRIVEPGQALELTNGAVKPVTDLLA
ncbi:MAG: MBL fold metallo-hydrolase [Caldilineaceae bacterium]